jgi:hypothetical protein
MTEDLTVEASQENGIAHRRLIMAGACPTCIWGPIERAVPARNRAGSNRIAQGCRQADDHAGSQRPVGLWTPRLARRLRLRCGKSTRRKPVTTQIPQPALFLRPEDRRERYRRCAASSRRRPLLSPARLPSEELKLRSHCYLVLLGGCAHAN